MEEDEVEVEVEVDIIAAVGRTGAKLKLPKATTGCLDAFGRGRAADDRGPKLHPQEITSTRVSRAVCDM